MILYERFTLDALPDISKPKRFKEN